MTDKLDQLKKALAALCDIGNMIDKAKNASAGLANKVLACVGLLVGDVGDFSALQGLSAAELKAEVEGLSPEDKADLAAYVGQKLQLAESEVEGKIVSAIELAFDIEAVVEKAIALVKPAPAPEAAPAEAPAAAPAPEAPAPEAPASS